MTDGFEHTPPNEDTDAGLAARFQALRAADAEIMPDVGALIGSVTTTRDDSGEDAATAWPPVWKRLAVVWKVAVPLAAAAALLVVLRGPEAEFRRTVMAYASSPALGAWTSPTDFLLQTPGNELLRQVPRIGQTTRIIDPAPVPDSTPDRDTTIGG